MMISILRSLFERDLKKLHSEIEAYSEEKNLWLVETAISNSAGNLCLHLIGNLNAFIGTQLGNTGYIRQRELEFSSKDVPRTVLLEQIHNTREMVKNTMDALSQEQLSEDFPILVFREKTSVGYFLTHLTTHLAYHLGQINYHRRLMDS